MTTALEKLQHFQHVRTEAWHAKRHERAQTFLNRFVRQNVAEIDEIRAKEYIWHTRVTPAERAVYLELKHHLEAMDMNIKGGGFKKTTVKKQSRTAKKFGAGAKKEGGGSEKKGGSSSSSSSSSSSKKMEEEDDDDESGAGGNDKDSRMAAVVSGCKSAEEALIKRAAIFDLEGDHATAQEECDAIAVQRERQLGVSSHFFVCC